MYQRVDQDNAGPIEGFAYENKDGTVERVKLDGAVVIIQTDDGLGCMDESFVYVSDIPNLIKALQAAYDHKKEQHGK